MKPKILIELQYLPPVSTFCYLLAASAVYFEACEHYQKGSYRNRCEIAGPNGRMRLSIPLLKGKHEGQPIREVQLAYFENWPKQHWQSIKTAYGSSPFFIHYSDAFRDILLARQDTLWALNLAMMKQILAFLGWSQELPIFESDVYMLGGAADVVDCRELISPQSSPLNLQPYVQVFTDKHGFLPNLSILDLLFCAGPAATDYLWAHAPQIPQV